MSNPFVRMSKMHKIIELCEEPKRFTELKRAIGISDPGLTKHLKSLQRLGWVRKMDDGRYGLTGSGREVLPTARRAALTLAEFKSTPMWVDGMNTTHFGVEGEDGIRLLSKVREAVMGYRKRHPDKAFVVSVIYKGEPDAPSGS